MPRLLQKSWLDSYLEYQEYTENPRNYNLWSGISVLSASLKRRVYVWYRQFKLYPNQYVVLVGGPGIGKGSAINPAVEIAETAGTINFIKDKTTPEKLIETVSTGYAKTVMSGPNTFNFVQDHTAQVVALEFPVFLANHDSMHSVLCAFWDQGKFSYSTKNKGSNQADDMSLSLVAGCVPDYVRSLSRDKMAAITGGFTARTIFVYATEKYQLLPDQFGAPAVNVNKLRDELINDLKHIASLQGEVTLSAEARKYWIAKYNEHNTKSNNDSDATATFKSRISTHILKTALTISISETDSLRIEESHLKRAVGYIEEVRDGVDIVFRTIGESPLVVSQDKIRTYIEQTGMASRTQLLRRFYRDVTDEQLTIVLFTLEKAGIIKESIQGSKIYYESVI